jgi:multicomponent Na+:H+ antiporter subunit E
VLWWVLTGGSPSSWWFGAPLALLATALALGHAAVVWRVSPLAVARFVPFFLWRALAGGLDVARRALDPRLPLAPGLVTLRLRLTGDAAVVLTAVVNLSPGTLTVDLNGDRVTLHVVDRHGPIEAQFRATEAAVARLLGVPLLSAEA